MKNCVALICGIQVERKSTKSDYQNNQTKKCSFSPNIELNHSKASSRSSKSQEIEYQQIIEAYHEVLPECPRIKVIDRKLKTQLNYMRKNWPQYQKEGRAFSIDSFKDYLNYIKKNYAWFTKPYTTESGKVKRNGLRVFTRETNISKIVNGEFSAS